MTVYDRNDELDALEAAFESPGHDFQVVYGRRRVGKTALLKAFCADRPHIYFLAAQEAEARQRPRYHVADKFLRFWFRFVEPNRSSIEEAPEMVFEGTVEPNLPDHVATTFEDICLDTVWAAIRDGEFEPYSEVGRWWYGEDEIDIVGLSPNDDRLLLAECKWTDEPVGHGLVEDLGAEADRVRWGPDSRKEWFALFSKRGFVDGLEDQVSEDWTLFSLTDIDRLLSPRE
jgi:AAA+ ATPase superfamily predicted ATPase